MKRAALLFLTSLAVPLSGCAGPRPVLYPNDRLEAVGQDAAETDIEDCRAKADAAGAHRDPGKATKVAKRTATGGGIGAAGGAVGGAITGSPGLGAAVGAASGATIGLLRGIFSEPKPSRVHIDFVNRCLGERGYEVVGWD